MKLAFLFDVKLDKYGEDYYSINLNEELWKTRYLPYFDEIKLICRRVDIDKDPSDKMHKTNVDHVKVYSFKNRNIFSRLLHLGEESKQIEEWIKDCDAVISRSFWGIYQAKKHNKPYMIEVVSCIWDSLWNHSIKGKILALPTMIMMKNAIKNSPFTLYVTERFLQEKYPSNGFEVGVSDVIIRPTSEEERKKRFIKIQNMNFKNKIKLGTAAAVDVKYKGQEFVIKAIELLKKEGIDDIEYHLAGGGDQSRLKKLAKKLNVADNIIFHGSVRHDDIIKFLDEIDIYIQPSLQEGLPRAVVEAMSRGCPCIGSNTGGIPELLMDDMICSKKKMSQEIVNKIKIMLCKEKMMSSAYYSFEKAQSFQKEILDTRRSDFMLKFVKYVKQNIKK
ncbi:glycosyltransferase [Fusobacterium hominis]|uniref:glycosyltransferase n=1 Tax=Fusobacterium hominis TaxID=2764326 RepID=UPI0022E6D62C|nr:glycosyltransferase [Fusobacterium hominis]